MLEIAPKEETPARAPWWLTVIRLALAALVIIAAAGPLWNPPLAAMKTRAPIAILIDDGWAAAASWDARLRTAEDIISRAENDHRAVALIPLSEGPRDISFATAGSARVRLQQIKPVPNTVDRAETLPAIRRFLADAREVEVVWLSDATDVGRGAEFVKKPRADARSASGHDCVRWYSATARAHGGRECSWSAGRKGGPRFDRRRHSRLGPGA